MAVFVMAVGILSMVVLYPLGLRESTQGRADLKQSIFADDVLNQMVGLLSQTNVTWTTWSGMMPSSGKKPNGWKEPSGNVKYEVACCEVDGYEKKVMGILVQSTELERAGNMNLYSNNPIYYAEVMFQGDATK